MPRTAGSKGKCHLTLKKTGSPGGLGHANGYQGAEQETLWKEGAKHISTESWGAPENNTSELWAMGRDEW